MLVTHKFPPLLNGRRDAVRAFCASSVRTRLEGALEGDSVGVMVIGSHSPNTTLILHYPSPSPWTAVLYKRVVFALCCSLFGV